MWPYLAAFSLPVVLYPLRRKNRTAFVFVLSAAWALFAGLRVDIGGSDYFAYRDYFAAINGMNVGDQFPFEPLFNLLAAAAKYLRLSWHDFLSVVGILGILPAVYVIDKRCKDSALSLFYFGMEWMLYASFVILRQGMALGFAFLAIDALFDKRRVRFVLFALIAALFHNSAFVLLPLVFFSSELKPRFRCLIFGLSALLFVAILVWSRLPFDYTKLPGRLPRMLYYLRGGYEPLNPFNFLEIGLFWLLIVFYAREAKGLAKNLYFFYSCFVLLSVAYSVVIRFGYFFEVGLVFLLPEIGDSPRASRTMKILLPAGIMAYALAKVCRWLILNGGGNGGFLPYRMIFG